MGGFGRYPRLWGAFARFALANEMAFRANFCMKMLVELLWLGILVVFYQTLFHFTSAVADWNNEQFMFFMGCYYAMEGLMETLFLEGCTEFAELVRSGNLDFYLLRPIDEQFLVTCRKVDWSTATKAPLGLAIMVAALAVMGWHFNLGEVALFALLFAGGIGIAYSALLMLTSASVWMMRNQSLFELWWLVTTLMRYPKEIYTGRGGSLVLFLFWWLLPVMLVTNVPARVMVHAFDPWNVLQLLVSVALLLLFSRWFFFRALRSYRSASS